MSNDIRMERSVAKACSTCKNYDYLSSTCLMDEFKLTPIQALAQVCQYYSDEGAVLNDYDRADRSIKFISVNLALEIVDNPKEDRPK